MAYVIHCRTGGMLLIGKLSPDRMKAGVRTKKLEEFHDRITSARVVVETPHCAHRKGNRRPPGSRKSPFYRVARGRIELPTP